MSRKCNKQNKKRRKTDWKNIKWCVCQHWQWLTCCWDSIGIEKKKLQVQNISFGNENKSTRLTHNLLCFGLYVENI